MRGCVWGVWAGQVGAGDEWPRCEVRRQGHEKVVDGQGPTGRSLKKDEEGAEVEWSTGGAWGKGRRVRDYVKGTTGGGLRNGPTWRG